MCCSPARRGWARPRWPTSSPTRWASTSSPRRGRPSNARPTWPPSSPTCEVGDVLFIDEIHRLNRAIEEILYPAMEDFEIDIIIGQGPSARTIRLDLPRFTLIGATTRSGLITTPLRDRFGFSHRLDYYTVEELSGIITPLGGHPGRRDRRGRGSRAGPALSRHAAHRQPAAQAGARFRAGAA